MRGRKLQGKVIKLPDGYDGVIVEDGGMAESSNTKKGDVAAEDSEDEEPDFRKLEQTGRFDEVILWDHEKLVEGDDAFVKGLSEWIEFAEAVWVSSLLIMLNDPADTRRSIVLRSK